MEHDPHGWRTWVVIGPRLCHVHLKSACLGCLAKLQTFNGGGRPRSEHSFLWNGIVNFNFSRALQPGRSRGLVTPRDQA